MGKGISLHVGLNSVDPSHYHGWSGDLAACEFDAKDMCSLAKKQGFDTSILLTADATVAAVSNGIRNASKALKSGDIFFMTYAGHGGQVRDVNGDERDGMDETWVLYDRMFVDDELYALWTKFKSGVRILVLSDSCHSGSVVREVASSTRGQPRHRAMPRATNDQVYRDHKRDYDRIQRGIEPHTEAKVRASVLLISGCMDNQFSSDGDRNGLFTETLKKVWTGGRFNGGYRRFRDTIAGRMPAIQTPNYLVIGKPNLDFEKQKPFTV